MTDRSAVDRALAEGHFWDCRQLTWLSPELQEAEADE